MPSPNLMAAALARRTKNATIMVLGNAIPVRGNPRRVAEEIAMLDHLTDGRLVSGFVRGIGWEHWVSGVAPSESRSRFNEAHDLIKKAWTTTGPFEWVGEHYEYRYVNTWPRPLQQPHPPIAVPGAGRSDEHPSELQPLMRISHVVFCLKNKSTSLVTLVTPLCLTTQLL